MIDEERDDSEFLYALSMNKNTAHLSPSSMEIPPIRTINPSIVSVMIGFWDIMHLSYETDLNHVVYKYNMLLDRLVEYTDPSCLILVHSLIPFDSTIMNPYYVSLIKNRITTFNQLLNQEVLRRNYLEEVSGTKKRFLWVDMNTPLLISSKDGPNHTYYIYEYGHYIHLNSIGYAVWKSILDGMKLPTKLYKDAHDTHRLTLTPIPAITSTPSYSSTLSYPFSVSMSVPTTPTLTQKHPHSSVWSYSPSHPASISTSVSKYMESDAVQGLEPELEPEPIESNVDINESGNEREQETFLDEDGGMEFTSGTTETPNYIIDLMFLLLMWWVSMFIVL